MNELMNNFMNQIEDVNKIKEITIEEFTKLVKSNQLISEEDGKKLIESFKKIASKKNSEDESDESDQRKKKYRNQHKSQLQENVKQQPSKEENEIDNEKENDENSRER